MSRCIILLTATITPNSTRTVKDSPESRATEYADAVDFYASTGRQIHFLENSDYEIRENGALSSALDKENVHLHRYPPSMEFSKGKGYQEFEMLDRFVKENGLRIPSYMKVSGRYRCENITALVGAWEARAERSLMIDRHRKMRVAITGVYACSMSFHRRRMSGKYLEADDSQGRFIEHVLYDALENDDKEVAMFPFNPVLKGISASSGASLARNPWKMRLRNIERRLLQVTGRSEFEIEY